MIPMLSNTQELFQLLHLVQDTRRELKRQGLKFDANMPIGGMIEVPAAAISASLFARHLDFLSIGTNDLIQYTLAIDRIDDEVNYLYDPLHPSVLRLDPPHHQSRRAGIDPGFHVRRNGRRLPLYPSVAGHGPARVQHASVDPAGSEEHYQAFGGGRSHPPCAPYPAQHSLRANPASVTPFERILIAGSSIVFGVPWTPLTIAATLAASVNWQREVTSHAFCRCGADQQRVSNRIDEPDHNRRRRSPRTPRPSGERHSSRRTGEGRSAAHARMAIFSYRVWSARSRFNPGAVGIRCCITRKTSTFRGTFGHGRSRNQQQHECRLQALTRALESGTLQNVWKMLNNLHPAEIAQLLESLPPTERDIVWKLVSPDNGGEVLLHVNDEVRARLISDMGPEELVAATEGMDMDDLADLLDDLPDTVIREVVRSMDKQNRRRLESVLSYPGGQRRRFDEHRHHHGALRRDPGRGVALSAPAG